MDEAAIGKRIRDLIGVILSSPLGGRPSTGSGPGICQPETSTKEASLTTSLRVCRRAPKGGNPTRTSRSG